MTSNSDWGHPSAPILLAPSEILHHQVRKAEVRHFVSSVPHHRSIGQRRRNSFPEKPTDDASGGGGGGGHDPSLRYSLQAPLKQTSAPHPPRLLQRQRDGLSKSSHELRTTTTSSFDGNSTEGTMALGSPRRSIHRRSQHRRNSIGPLHNSSSHNHNSSHHHKKQEIDDEQWSQSMRSLIVGGDDKKDEDTPVLHRSLPQIQYLAEDRWSSTASPTVTGNRKQLQTQVHQQDQLHISPNAASSLVPPTRPGRTKSNDSLPIVGPPLGLEDDDDQENTENAEYGDMALKDEKNDIPPPPPEELSPSPRHRHRKGSTGDTAGVQSAPSTPSGARARFNDRRRESRSTTSGGSSSAPKQEDDDDDLYDLFLQSSSGKKEDFATWLAAHKKSPQMTTTSMSTTPFSTITTPQQRQRQRRRGSTGALAQKWEEELLPSLIQPKSPVKTAVSPSPSPTRQSARRGSMGALVEKWEQLSSSHHRRMDVTGNTTTQNVGETNDPETQDELQNYNNTGAGDWGNIKNNDDDNLEMSFGEFGTMEIKDNHAVQPQKPHKQKRRGSTGALKKKNREMDHDITESKSKSSSKTKRRGSTGHLAEAAANLVEKKKKKDKNDASDHSKTKKKKTRRAVSESRLDVATNSSLHASAPAIFLQIEQKQDQQSPGEASSEESPFAVRPPQSLSLTNLAAIHTKSKKRSSSATKKKKKSDDMDSSKRSSSSHTSKVKSDMDSSHTSKRKSSVSARELPPKSPSKPSFRKSSASKTKSATSSSTNPADLTGTDSTTIPKNSSNGAGGKTDQKIEKKRSGLGSRLNGLLGKVVHKGHRRVLSDGHVVAPPGNSGEKIKETKKNKRTSNSTNKSNTAAATT